MRGCGGGGGFGRSSVGKHASSPADADRPRCVLAAHSIMLCMHIAHHVLLAFDQLTNESSSACVS